MLVCVIAFCNVETDIYNLYKYAFLATINLHNNTQCIDNSLRCDSRENYVVFQTLSHVERVSSAVTMPSILKGKEHKNINEVCLKVFEK